MHAFTADPGSLPSPDACGGVVDGVIVLLVQKFGHPDHP
jgi:hypothetical protein